MQKKIAVVLFNLGGPDSASAIKPFLFNLFNDKAIISLPQPFRFLLAKLISSRREEEAGHIYAQIGGRSPILPLTEKQAHALTEKLNEKSGGIYKVFIAMRYWHPRAEDVANEVKEFGADEVILLPLYPQFSTTTTGSSVKEWSKYARKFSLPKAKTICCYPMEEKFITAHADLIKPYYERAAKAGNNPRILFSAHGLPEKIIAAGDPYQWQVEKTAEAIIKKLNIKNLDSQVCYQSRVGPLKWIGPATDEEIIRAGKDGVPLVIVPVAFVSEHSETLVELDLQYKKLAEDNGVKGYFRVPALGADENFIESLAGLCLSAAEKKEAGIFPPGGVRLCPESFSKCACSGQN